MPPVDCWYIADQFFAYLTKKCPPVSRRAFMFVFFLLQAFFNSNSHGNGHADHGVVTCFVVLAYRAYRTSFC